jgi:hypothetical protein
MRKLREVLRLRFELKVGYQQIGRSCAIAVSTVHKYLKRAEAAGVSWPRPEDWTRPGWRRRCSHRRCRRQRSHKRLARHPTLPRCMSSCGNTVISLCKCCGRSTGKPIQRLPLFALLRTVPALAVEAERGAAAGSIRQARRCSSIRRARPFRYTTGTPATCGKPLYSWPL